jgi:RNA polymerase sigma factor (sigma-70 family)
MKKLTKAQEAIVDSHLRLVRPLALRLAARLPVSIELDDLIQAGRLGLVKAVRRLDRSKLGTSIESYVYHRIRGAMLDTLKRGNLNYEYHEGLSIVEVTSTESPEECVALKQRKALLQAAVYRLDPITARAITMHGDGATFEQIGAKLGGRCASWAHGRVQAGLARLREDRTLKDAA